MQICSPPDSKGVYTTRWSIARKVFSFQAVVFSFMLRWLWTFLKMMSYSSLEFCCQIVMEVTFLQKYYAISYYCYKFCLHYFRRGAKFNYTPPPSTRNKLSLSAIIQSSWPNQFKIFSFSRKSNFGAENSFALNFQSKSQQQLPV